MSLKRRPKQIREIYPLLRLLKDQSNNSEFRKSIIKHITDDGIDTICYCINESIHHRSVPKEVREIVKKELLPYKNNIRYLRRNPNKPAKNRQRLEQFGAGLGTLLAVAIPLVSSLLLGNKH